MNLLRSLIIRVRNIFGRLKIGARNLRRRLGKAIERDPVRSFYIALGVLLLLIIASNILGNQKPAENAEPAIVKDIEVFTIGTVPRVKVLAKVEKSGVVSVTALSPGVVSYIRTPVGTKVTKGQNLLGMASNYQGGNASSLSRALAGVQYKNAVETKDLQLDLIRRQRELAEKSGENADELRRITDEARRETDILIGLNNEILAALDANIADLESTNAGGANDALILSTKQLKAQFLAAQNAARQGARMAELGSVETKPQAELSNMQKEMTLRQLDLQEKMVGINIEVARLQHALAKAVEGMMYPSSPITGVVEKVNVKIGEAVNPGTELMVISGDAGSFATRATAYIGAGLARKVSATEESMLTLIDGEKVSLRPYYVSREGVSGTAHGVYFLIPPENAARTTEGGYVSVDLPVGYSDTTGTIPFVPIDAVYQTKEASTVFVDNQGKAEARTVTLGNVTGSFVEVTDGLSSGDAVILTRTVVAGDQVRRIQQ